nr:four helix bundle protein [Pedobacter sp. ASV2]
MEKNYLQLNQITAYTKSFHLSNLVWEITSNWDNFAKYSIGQQFVNAVDSISANIAEGFGRYHKKDKVKFYYIVLAQLKSVLIGTKRRK